jgi:uncharacterized protein YceK
MAADSLLWPGCGSVFEQVFMPFDWQSQLPASVNFQTQLLPCYYFHSAWM